MSLVFLYSKDKAPNLSQEAVNSLCFLDEFANYSHMSRRVSCNIIIL